MISINFNENDKQLRFLSAILFLFLISNSFANPKPTKKSPNIILILVDDLGYEALGCYGGTSYKTPNIDKLSKTGMQFNQAFAQPLCTNTRVKLMTGKYNYRNWTAFGILTPQGKTFGHLMQEAGYKTCLAGKWQLHSYDPIDYPGAENRRATGMELKNAGFDEYIAWHVGHTEDKGSRFADPVIIENGKQLTNTKGKYGPDIFSSYVFDFIDRQTNEPFFVYYPMVLTHDPFSPTPESSVWKDKSKRFEDDPKYFGDMVAYTDKIVGNLVQKLKEKGIEKETLILFYTDNGTHQKVTSKMGNKLVQGGKGLTIESGIKVPFIANWPKNIKKGQQKNDFIDAIDFLPTLLEVAGKKVPNDFQTDGQSFYSILKSEPAKRRDWVYMSYNPKPGVGKSKFSPAEFVLNENYKLYGDGRFYNIKKDILEKSQLTHTLTSKENLVKTRFTKIIDSLKKYPSHGKIVRLDAALDNIISKNARVELIAEGFNWSEGPAWFSKGQKLVFSDVPENKAYEWNDITGLKLFLAPSGGIANTSAKKVKGSNGLLVDKKGNLLLCQVADRRISKLTEYKSPNEVTFNPLTTNYKGAKFNSPNDLTFDNYNNIYFTDPTFGLGLGKKSDIGFNGVYFLAQNGEAKLVTKDIKLPNGIAVSNDNKTLYVADSDKNYPKIYAFDIVKNEKVENGRIFFDATKLYKSSREKQCPDGMKVDKNGNLFVAGPGGVLIITPEGKHIGTINTDRKTGNCVFSDDGRFLFITADDLILRVNLRPYHK
ncbi:sulfatase-like hydrolase/transferase [Flavicella sediminum]|uniref:sulfatase-like hydrolase/transferase n=1 Tax=Flavicella sediminum TaxID=2585141 RepID=UPI001123849E|nr:sulfatase-like hydrolase/transferase [Flavicella sediminum]